MLRRFLRWVTPSAANPTHLPVIDPTRRAFLFGAAATLIIPPPKTFHILPKQDQILRLPPPIVLPNGKLFDLPNREALQLAQKLIDEHYGMADIPRWIVVDKEWYDMVVKSEAENGRQRQIAERRARNRHGVLT